MDLLIHVKVISESPQEVDPNIQTIQERSDVQRVEPLIGYFSKEKNKRHSLTGSQGRDALNTSTWISNKKSCDRSGLPDFTW